MRKSERDAILRMITIWRHGCSNVGVYSVLNMEVPAPRVRTHAVVAHVRMVSLTPLKSM